MNIEILEPKDLEKFRQLLLADIQKIMQMNHPKKWLKTKEVMELLGLSEVTLQTLRKRKQIPFGKLGGVCYYSAEELDSHLTNLN